MSCVFETLLAALVLVAVSTGASLTAAVLPAQQAAAGQEARATAETQAAERLLVESYIKAGPGHRQSWEAKIRRSRVGSALLTAIHGELAAGRVIPEGALGLLFEIVPARESQRCHSLRKWLAVGGKQMLLEWMCRRDLKGFRDHSYRSLGGVLSRVLDTLVDLKERGFWVEVVTLLVPGFNDSDEEVGDLTRFLADLDPLLPWHVTAFHADYKMTENPNTPVDSLMRAAEIAEAAGLKYIYCGNRSGDVKEWENTRCHECGSTLVRRIGFRILENRLLPGGVCPGCSTRIPGVWD